jgi:hypothetical protein
MKLISNEDYAKIRNQNKEKMIGLKATRSVCVGPDARFSFECYETLWTQIQEMLYIEGGGKEQEADELSAYGPLVPQGSDLVATLFFEIENEALRREKLQAWGGIEKTVFLEIDGEKVYAQNTDHLERTNEQGKTSAVHFLRFQINDSQKNAFRNEKIVLGFDFQKYGHMTVLSQETCSALSKDFV